MEPDVSSQVEHLCRQNQDPSFRKFAAECVLVGFRMGLRHATSIALMQPMFNVIPDGKGGVSEPITEKTPEQMRNDIADAIDRAANPRGN